MQSLEVEMVPEDLGKPSSGQPRLLACLRRGQRGVAVVQPQDNEQAEFGDQDSTKCLRLT
jgi:hypothetical protein